MVHKYKCHFFLTGHDAKITTLNVCSSSDREFVRFKARADVSVTRHKQPVCFVAAAWGFIFSSWKRIDGLVHPACRNT